MLAPYPSISPDQLWSKCCSHFWSKPAKPYHFIFTAAQSILTAFKTF